MVIIKSILDKRFFVEHAKTHAEIYPLWKDRLPSVVKKSLFRPKNRLEIGNSDSEFAGEPIYIPKVDQHGRPIRISMLIIGPPGTKKTITMKNITAQIFNLGESPVIVPDPRIEQASSQKLPKNSKNIPENYIPMTLPTEIYVPKYCVNRFHRLPKDVKKDNIFQFNMSDVERMDMYTLLDVDGQDVTSVNSQWLLNKAFNILEKKKLEERNLKTFEESVMKVKQTGEMTGGVHIYTRRKIMGRVETLKGADVLGDEKKDFVENIRKKKIPVLSNKYSPNTKWDQAYASVFMRKFYNERMEFLAGIKERVAPLWFFCDELQILAQSGTASYDTLLNLILRQGRQPLDNFVGATQTLSITTGGINLEILGLIDYILMAKLPNVQDLIAICRSKGVSEYERRSILEQLEFDKKQNLYEYALINPNGEITTYFPYDPIVGHVFEGM